MSKSLDEVLEGIPDLDFTDGISAESIETDMIADYSEKMSELTGKDFQLTRTDPMRAVILSAADILDQMVNLIDRNAKMNFLKYAYGEYLDHLGALKGVSRNDAVPAVCTLQFMAEEEPSADITIPVGTEVTGEDDVYFTTDQEAVIEAATYASSTVTITLSSAYGSDIVIPAGTEFSSADGVYIFKATTQSTLAAGETSISIDTAADEPGEVGNGAAENALTETELAVPNLSAITSTAAIGGQNSSRIAKVTATCETPGAIGNDFQPGEINEMIDEIDGVDDVMNLDVSSGGADAEDDDDLRQRIYDAPLTYTTTGPTYAYRTKALAFSSAVKDAQVISPTPGEVDIYVIGEDGQLLSDEIKQQIYDSLSADDSRPLTDTVYVKDPTITNYNIDLTYHIAKSDEKAAETIQDDVADAVEQYQTWQCSRIGRPIDPSELTALLRDVGAVQCTVTSPTITQIDKTAVAVADSITVNYGGIVNG